jgi:hypothetical protein
MKGQLSMESINDMMGNLDPSLDSEMTEDELNSLKDEILMTSGAANVSVNTNQQGETQTQTQGNDDFFSELNI